MNENNVLVGYCGLNCAECFSYKKTVSEAAKALRRELREELGLEVGTVSWLGSEPNEYEYEGITYRTLDLLFRCEAADLSSVKPLAEIKEILLENRYASPGVRIPNMREVIPIEAGAEQTLDELERQAVIDALEHTHGNRRKAAGLLGIGERTLYRKIKQYGVGKK